jgi:hypothetical protein
LARLNVDDAWFDDPRRDNLIERIGSIKADGVALKMWRLAQTYFREGNRVSSDLYFKIPHAQDFLDVKLARVEGSEVYICGSNERFAWLQTKTEAASKAGKASAAARAAKYGSAQPKKPSNESSNGTQTTRSNDRTERSGFSNATEPSSSSSSSSSSSPSSSDSSVLTNGTADAGAQQSFEEVLKAPRKPGKKKAPEVPGHLVAEAVRHYCDAWKVAYRAERSPDIGGYGTGKLKNMVRDFGVDRTKALISAYLKMPDRFYVQKRHDIHTLSVNLTAVGHFAESRRHITQAELAKLDRDATNANTMEAIEKGDI